MEAGYRGVNLQDYLSDELLDDIIDRSLEEDIGPGDITSQALLPPDLTGRAYLLAKAPGLLAGSGVARRVFQRTDPSLEITIIVEDGRTVRPGDVIARISGKVASILRAERVALNFLQRLSGIATTTAQYVAEVKGLRVKILDTRKTTPGLRPLEKYAVRVGGGANHRFHLGDAILIKDNHLVAMRSMGIGLKEAIGRARQNVPAGISIEVEVTSLSEAREALAAGADIIMLDNMGIDEMRKVVELVSGRARLEASGGITLGNVRQVALTGVDMISIGALTHSYRVLDISLELETPFLQKMGLD